MWGRRGQKEAYQLSKVLKLKPNKLIPLSAEEEIEIERFFKAYSSKDRQMG